MRPSQTDSRHSGQSANAQCDVDQSKAERSRTTPSNEDRGPGAISSRSSDQNLALEAQFDGERNRLRPIYVRLTEVLVELGPEVRILPRKTYVSVFRAQQFAIVRVTTTSKIDLGLKLPGVEPNGRLLEASSFLNERITHRVELTCLEDVDEELIGWISEAYRRSI